MLELVEQLLALPQEERIRIVMTILLSIQEENSAHDSELEALQEQLKQGKIRYYSESDFWAEARKRIS